MLGSAPAALAASYDLAILDLDGVVYIGAAAVEGAPGHLAVAAAAGMRVAYVTNNASRSPAAVARHLRELGVPVDSHDVVTSAQAAARLVARDVPAGSTVYVIGGEGLVEALAEHGLVATQSSRDEPAAVVSGYHPELLWQTVLHGAILVKEGLPWVASNTDMTVPTPRGLGPGNGVLVDAVARFAGREPRVAGKPQRPLFDETVHRMGGARPLVVGDRLDTDIAGANNASLDSLLVMTGVTGVQELVTAPPALRPTYVSADLAGLNTSHPVPSTSGRSTLLNGWTAAVALDVLDVTGHGSADDWWRVVAATAWRHLDTTGTPVNAGNTRPPASV